MNDNRETQLRKLVDLLSLAYEVISKQEDYVLKLQAELTVRGLKIPEPER